MCIRDRSSNGVLYRSDKKGLIPALLEKWFDTRVEYRKLMKKFGDAGDNEKYSYFKSRQLIQKVVLNSLYGVLGLPVFRFYDLDNAEATTLTGQELIKFTKKIGNHFYNKELGDDKDYCIYIDTDSVFYSAIPLVKKDPQAMGSAITYGRRYSLAAILNMAQIDDDAESSLARGITNQQRQRS